MQTNRPCVCVVCSQYFSSFENIVVIDELDYVLLCVCLHCLNGGQK